ncbi:MAG: DUF4136 domain-containing protein [Pseudomonadota bacterium]
MNYRWMLLAVVGAALLGGCTSAPYKTDFDYNPEVIFTNYRTWAWIDDTPMAEGEGTPVNPLIQGRIMFHIEEEMSMKGFRKVDNVEDADMAVAFSVGARDKIKVNSYPSTFHGGYSRWGYGWGYGYGYPAREVDVRQYTEGQVAIDIFDVKRKEPVYHGFATGNVRENRTREEREQLIDDIIRDILLTFPPA